MFALQKLFTRYRRNDLSDLQECIVAEITVEKERCFFICLYRSPSQNDDELETFCSDRTFPFKDTLKALGDFKNKQKNGMKYCFLICKSMYILKLYSIHYTLRQNTNLKKIPFGQNKVKPYKKCPLFSFASSNSPQFYF